MLTRLFAVDERSNHFVDEPPSRAQGGDLLRYGQAARYMADPKNNAGTPNPSFKIQLDQTRLEWKRRHSGLPLSESV
jgi:hypothetical protein